MKTITLNILRSVVMDGVKIDTHIRGLIDKSTDERATSLAYQETAGDEDEHERKLFASMVSSAESLSTIFSDYLGYKQQSNGDNSVIVSFDDTDKIVYSLFVSDRFNENYTESLARLASSYISLSMLMDWYDVVNPKQSEIYEKAASKKLMDIKRCFNKLPPSPPKYPFTQNLTTDKDEVVITLPKDYFKVEHSMTELIQHEVVVNYTIDENTIDDIMFTTNARKFAIVNHATFGAINIIPTGLGEGSLVLWSRHMEAETKKIINIKVEYESQE